MRKAATLPLKKRLIRLSLLSTVTALVVASTLLMYGEFVATKSALIEDLGALANSTGASCTAALTFQDRRSAEEILGALRGISHIESATLFDKDGDVFASYVRRNGQGNPVPLTGPHRQYSFQAGKMTYAQSVVLDGERIGTISLQSGLSGFYRHLAFRALILLLSIIVSAAVAYLIISRLQKVVTGPVISLSGLMDAVSRDRDYSVRAIRETNDEIGSLVTGFNEMLAQIQERDVELEAHRKHLEGIVAERTSQLAGAYERLQRALDEMVETMAIIVEVKDPYTAGHQKRVAKLATALAAEMGLSPQEQNSIRIACLLHDIGKIQVPAEILSKGRSLTAMELNLVREHARSGYEILRGIHFPFPVADTILQHHERMDGSGYPGGLRGEQIQLGARILAVADVVEAMVSHRPYRAALTMEDALQEIVRNRGRLYDGAVTDACLKLIQERGFSFEQ